MNTYIYIRPARYQCTHCNGNPVTTQTLNWYDPRSPHTKTYEGHVLLEMVNSTVEDVSIKEGLGYEAVMGILYRYIDTEVNWDRIDRLDTIGLDEISLKKGRKDFVTIVTSRVDGKTTILAVLKGRKKKTVKEFLSSIPKRLKKTVKGVCSDMYEGYINAAAEVFEKDVIIIVDRFHVAKLYRNDLDGLRKKEMKRLKKELSEEEYKKLEGVMWMLRKDAKELTDEKLEVLKCLFQHSPILELAYKLCNDLTDIFKEDIPKSAATRKINDWMKKVEESSLKCFNKFLSTLDKYMDKITNYFTNRQTSGFVEGLNNKIKVIKRRCYGILNVKNLFQRIYLDLEGYSLYA
ncbi:MAG: ISL3 family transposase [Euryarchaeota archaeon]|nr:ISL3 family transposase [Euryarchaeota archaeon]